MRQSLRHHDANAGLRRQLARHRFAIAGQKRLARQPQFAQFLQRTLRLHAHRIGEPEPCKEAAVQRKTNTRSFDRAARFREHRYVLREQTGAAEHGHPVRRLGDDTQASQFACVFERHAFESGRLDVGHVTHQRPAHRMRTAAAEPGSEFKHHRNVDTRLQQHVLDAQFAIRQCAGLVDHQRIDLRELVKERRAPEQDAVACRHRDPGNRRGGCSEHERARTRRDDHGQHRRCVRRDEPHNRGNQQDEAQITAHVAFEYLRDRGLGLLRALHQLDDLAERRLLARMRDLDTQRTVQVHRATEYGSARFDVERHRLAGNRTIVDAGLPVQHDAIGGNSRAGYDFDLIRGPHRVIRHFFDRAVGVDPPHLARGQPAERPDRLLRAEHTAFFERMAERHDDRQERGRRHVPHGPRRQHRERDQTIGDAVQTGRLQTSPCTRKNRPGDDERRESRQHLRNHFISRRDVMPCGRQHEQAAGQ